MPLGLKSKRATFSKAARPIYSNSVNQFMPCPLGSDFRCGTFGAFSGEANAGFSFSFGKAGFLLFRGDAILIALALFLADVLMAD